MKRKLITFDQYMNESLNENKQINIDGFNSFISQLLLNEELEGMEDFYGPLVLEKKTSGNRLVDYLNDCSILEGLGYEEFTEEEKYELENAVWEGVLFYATNDGVLTESELHEGIWRSIVGGVGKLKEIGSKALTWAMSTLASIGKILKAIGEYVKAFFAKVAELGKKAAKAVLGSITGKIEEKFANRKKKFSEDAVKKEGGEMKETAQWISDSIEGLLNKGMKDGEGAAQDAASQDKEEREKLIDGIKKEMLDGATTESFTVSERSLIHVINEIRAMEDFDFSSLIIAAKISEKSKDLNEGATESDLMTDEFINELFGWEKKKEAEKEAPTVDEDPNKKSSLVGKAVKGLKMVVSIFVSGIVFFFEKAIEYLLREHAFPRLSAWVAKAGGPGVFKFAMTAGVIAILLATIAEFGLDILKSLTGTDALDGVLHMVHGLNPLHIVEHALHIPGGAVVAKAIAVVWCSYQAYEHISHLLHGDHHGEEHGEGEHASAH